MADIPGSTIDTTSLLTILGVIAAVWAIVPATTKLGFRLSLSLIDWAIIIFTLLLIHYLAFEPTLRALGWYFSFGPWRWSLTSSSVIYLLMLGMSGYIYVRLRTATLARRNIGTFERLFDALLLTKKYDQLAALLDTHIKSVFKIAEQPARRCWLASMLDRDRSAHFPDTAEKPEHSFTRQICKAKNWLARRLLPETTPEDTAKHILMRLLSSPSLAAHLAVNQPRLCLKILRIPRSLRSDFGNLFFQALISDESSIFYSELKNNTGTSGTYRTPPISANKLLSFYLKDVRVAQAHAVYQSVAQALFQKIDGNEALAKACNEPLGYYEEEGRYKCPIYCGLQFFKIMIHEANHQQLHNHLWLHHLPHFTDKILAKLRDPRPDDSQYEYPTRFHYLIYQITSITMHWIDDAQYTPANNSEPKTRLYIPFQATKAMARILSSVIGASQLDDSFKTYILEIVLRGIYRAGKHPSLQLVMESLVDEIICVRDSYSSAAGYLAQLSQAHSMMDPEIVHSSVAFEKKLQDKIVSVGRNPR